MLNCRSIKNKIEDFNSLIHTVKPTVVICTESWLDEDIADSEVFPNYFARYRKDRNSHEEAVFILVDQGIPSKIILVDNLCEAVWCQQRFCNEKTLSYVPFTVHLPRRHVRPFLLLQAYVGSAPLF